MASELKYLSLKYAYDYVFTTTPIGAVQKDVTLILQKFLWSAYNTLLSLSSILYYILLILFKLLILAFPHAMKIFSKIYHFHRTQMTTYDIIVEVLLVTVLLVYVIFRERIARAWNKFEAYVSAKSRSAARAAPHVAFFSSALLVSVLGRKFILPLTASSTMPIFTLLIPVLNMYRYLPRVSSVADEVKISEALKNPLIVWVILGIYHSIVTALSSIPFSRRILTLLPYLKELIIVIIIWSQLSPVFTDIVFTSVIAPILTRLSAHIPTARIEESVRSSFSLVSVLKTIRLVNDVQADFLEKILQDSVVSLLALGFIFTPSPLADIGMVLIAFLVPCYRTVQIISGINQRIVISSVRASRNSTSQQQGLVNEHILLAGYDLWLHYWLCIGLLWLFRIYLIRPWPSMTILMAVFLQHAYVKGALRSRRFVQETSCLLQERHQRIALERRAIAQSTETIAIAEIVTETREERWEAEREQEVVAEEREERRSETEGGNIAVDSEELSERNSSPTIETPGSASIRRRAHK